MLPSPSMMNPLPAPRRGVSPRGLLKSGRSNRSGGSGSSERRRRRESPVPREVASMLTTAGFMRSTTSAKLMSVPPAGALAARIDAAGVGCRSRATAVTAARSKPPATIAPTRNATMAVRTMLTIVKRRDMGLGLFFHYKSAERRLIQRFDSELLRLIELGARLGPGDDIGRLSADRPGHFGA